MSSDEFHFLGLDDIPTKGKTVFVRVDINCPLDPSSNKILDDTRIRMCKDTVESLRDAKVVVGSHQGRPGDDDFTTLEAHAKLLGKYVSRQVEFVEDTIGPEALSRIRALKAGEVLVLDNLRLCAEESISGAPEVLANTIMVQRLAKVLDVYVNDAFATAHRAQTSIVGLPQVVPAVAGRLMARELEALRQAYHAPEHPSTYVIGGAKADDKLPIIENILRTGKADRVLVGGVVANVLLRASGTDFGDVENRSLEKSAVVFEKAHSILAKYGDRVVLPRDLAVEQGGNRVDQPIAKGLTAGVVKDIGRDTAEEYARIIGESKTIVSSGPLGMFEEKGFDLGSRTVLEAMAGQRTFTVVGGGHMASYANMLGVAGRISHVSTAGGAMLAFLAGEEMPGVKALIDSARRQLARQHNK